MVNLGKYLGSDCMRKIIELNLFLYIFSIYFYGVFPHMFFVTNLLGLLMFLNCLFYIILNRKKIKISPVVIWMFIFALISCLSIYKSIEQDVTFSIIRILFSIFLVCFATSIYVDSKEKIENIIRYFIYCGFLLSIYALISFDYSLLGLRRFDSAGNPNVVSILCVVSFIFGIYYFLAKKKYLVLLTWIPILPVVILTASRKGTILIIFTIILLIFLNNYNKNFAFIRSILKIGILMVTTFFILNLTPLSEPMMTRMKNFVIDILNIEQVEDGSLNSRNLMIQKGIGYFTEKPILGHGLDQFRVLFEKEPFGRRTYSHNNFVELLVSTGIIGFLIYYSIYAYLFGIFVKYKLYKYFLCNIHLTLLAGLFLIGYGEVQYYDYKTYLLLIITNAVFQIYINSERISRRGKRLVNLNIS